MKFVTILHNMLVEHVRNGYESVLFLEEEKTVKSG